MGFTVSGAVRLDIASKIGGVGALRPGRCLYQMTQNGMEQDALDFMANTCADPKDCNVTVMAHDNLPVDEPDGRNDSWNVVADGDTGLICGFEGREFVVYGMVKGVSFVIDAEVLE